MLRPATHSINDTASVSDIITGLEIKFSIEHMQRVWHAYLGRLLLRIPGLVFFGTFRYSTCCNQFFPELVVIFSDYAIRTSLGTISILFSILSTVCDQMMVVNLNYSHISKVMVKVHKWLKFASMSYVFIYSFDVLYFLQLSVPRNVRTKNHTTRQVWGRLVSTIKHMQVKKLGMIRCPKEYAFSVGMPDLLKMLWKPLTIW